MNIRKITKAASSYLTDPAYRFKINAHRGKYASMPDAEYLTKMLCAYTGVKADLDHPETFNEKLQWLKLHDRNPDYTVMVDKFKVRDYIAQTIGEEYLIPLLGAWDDPDEIDFDTLPEQFVLKCNHNSGFGMCICKDKAALDRDKVKAELQKGLAQDYYLSGREWPYKEVPRKIIAEKFMSDGENELADYKFHNFNGIPKLILVCRDRFQPTGLTEDFFDEKWNHLELSRPNIPCSKNPLLKPKELDLMLELSAKLSQDIPFLRTDFYVIEGRVYFGELTFFPASGFAPFVPAKWDAILGSWLTLPEGKPKNIL